MTGPLWQHGKPTRGMRWPVWPPASVDDSVQSQTHCGSQHLMAVIISLCWSQILTAFSHKLGVHCPTVSKSVYDLRIKVDGWKPWKCWKFCCLSTMEKLSYGWMVIKAMETDEENKSWMAVRTHFCVSAFYKLGDSHRTQLSQMRQTQDAEAQQQWSRK